MMRGLGDFLRIGRSDVVMSVGPKTFVSKIVRRYSRLGGHCSSRSGQTPALLIRTSSWGKSCSIFLLADSIEVSSLASRWMRDTVP